MMATETNGVIGHYPSDPTQYVQELIQAFKAPTLDLKLVCHGTYGLAGFALNVFVGEPGLATMDQNSLFGALTNLVLQIEQAVNLPEWLKLILNQTLSLLIAWLKAKFAALPAVA